MSFFYVYLGNIFVLYDTFLSLSFRGFGSPQGTIIIGVISTYFHINNIFKFSNRHDDHRDNDERSG
jgi:hypothetical protein